MIASLYTQYQDYVTRICFRYVKNREDAEDLAQEVFIKAMNRIGSFQGDSQLSTWLYRVAANHCLDYLRWKKRQGVLHEECHAEAWNDSGDDVYECKADRRLADLVLEKSDPEDRQLLFLHFEAGLTHGEIAEIEGVSRVAITKRLAKAQARIRHIRQGFEENFLSLPIAA